jgi:hypothetical protein
MATNPQFAVDPKTRFVTLSTATLGVRNNPATASNLLISGRNTTGYSGTKITQIGAKFLATNAACTILIFITDNTGVVGTGVLYDELTFTAVTASTTAVSARQLTLYTDLQLEPGQNIYVSCSIATNTTNVIVFCSAGDF